MGTMPLSDPGGICSNRCLHAPIASPPPVAESREHYTAWPYLSGMEKRDTRGLGGFSFCFVVPSPRQQRPKPMRETDTFAKSA